MQGEEKERTRVAKDLHDGVAGMLAASKMHFNSIGTQYAELVQLSAFKQGLNLLDEAATEVRKTSHNLMPEILLQYGLDQAIRRYCSNINNSRAISIIYDSWGEINRYNDSFELSVYRIVQELLNNIVKHSKATQALVQVSQQNEVLSITIEDNGVGMQENKEMDGTGLQSLASRAKAMNGKIELESRPGHGVCAYLEFDISEMEKTASHATN
nr:ATP-binding protein [Flavihumibacter fluminis]